MTGWLVVRTQTRAEEKARMHLLNQGFDVYLPRYRKQISHARKRQTVLRPLFSGYLFVRIDDAFGHWRSINGTVGVVGLVQFSGRPATLSSSAVDAIRDREDDGGAVALAPCGLKVGDEVRLREGAFADYTALLEEISDEKRAVLLLDLMGRKVRTTVPIENLTKTG